VKHTTYLRFRLFYKENPRRRRFKTVWDVINYFKEVNLFYDKKKSISVIRVFLEV